MSSKNVSLRSAEPPLRRGFTLIELMLGVLIVCVLLAIAYPSFVDQVRKSRRSDAIAALTAVQQAQERWRANNPAYANFNTAVAPAVNGLTVPAISGSGYYSLSIDGLTATTYTLLAEAAEGKSQVHDGNCRRMGVQARNGILRYGSGAAAIAWEDANANANANPDLGNCWAR